MKNVCVCGKGVGICTEVYISRIWCSVDCMGLYEQYYSSFTF
jgi:hypothetical protein